MEVCYYKFNLLKSYTSKERLKKGGHYGKHFSM